LRKIPLFKNFTYKKIDTLSGLIKIENFEEGKKIITQGENSTKFYILKSGKIDIFVNNNYIRSLNPNEYFGERALFFNEPRSATAIATENVLAYVIDKEDFKKIIETNLKEYLINRFFLQDNTIQLEDLDYVKELGNGNYGTVSLVITRNTGFFYAIKSISKKQIDCEQLHKNLELERSILLQIDHPFIVKLVKTLKDSRFVYFLMEYIKGKELFDVIRDIGLLNDFQCKFYSCSILLAVEYLHERKFIYRDIKPENIIVNEKVLTNFI
jgi:cGMP-dependent protein kinase